MIGTGLTGKVADAKEHDPRVKVVFNEHAVMNTATMATWVELFSSSTSCGPDSLLLLDHCGAHRAIAWPCTTQFVPKGVQSPPTDKPQHSAPHRDGVTCLVARGGRRPRPFPFWVVENKPPSPRP